MNINVSDAAIIGGGPAGMSAALVLGRATRDILVFDDGQPRNQVTKHTHGFLTQDGTSPAKFRQIAQLQIAEYPNVQFRHEKVIDISGSSGHFILRTDAGGQYACKKILFAVGMRDKPLSIEGLSEVYGKSAFVCPYCDGWELRKKSLILIANGMNGLHLAKTLSGWTKQFVMCTNGDDGWTKEQRADISEHQISVYTSPIARIQSESGMVTHVELQNGTTLPCQAIFFAPQLTIGSELPLTIGCEMTEEGKLFIDAYGKTNIPGIFAAGDATTRYYQAIYAAAMGSVAASTINSELLDESWREKM